MLNMFSNAATAFDQSLIVGMDDAIAAGLAWVTPQLRVAMMLYVIGMGLLTMYHKADSWSFVHAAVKGIALGAIIRITNYNYYVRDLFFYDLPNTFAAALHGPRAAVDSAQQFDVLWSGALHFCGFVLGQATGLSHLVDRGVVWALAGLILLALWLCFIVWYLARVFMALVICLGTFMLVLALFQQTRGYVEQWIGKLVGLTMLQLTSSILLRIVLVIMNDRLLIMKNDTTMSVDLLITAFAGVCGVFWMGALLMIALPSVIAIGSGVGAGVVVTSGMLGSVGVAAGGLAKAGITRAGRLGMSLGRYTGSS
jgi:TrbL/VirB6 plasmid conjugal transfer protein